MTTAYEDIVKETLEREGVEGLKKLKKEIENVNDSEFNPYDLNNPNIGMVKIKNNKKS